jgi:translation initiation factor 2B subunit (eIF-2B alpha/beta/delta family)
MDYQKKRKKISKIVRDIKEIKIQGARNIAKKALEAYNLIPTEKTKKRLVSARPTEPMLVNTLANYKKLGYEETLKHFDSAQKKINEHVFDLIDNNDVIYTHCHSSNVINALIYAKRKGKKFEVYNTETRPSFQGRKTARELRAAGIPVTMFIDSAMNVALTSNQKTKDVDKIFLGSDALLKKGIINKIGSGTIAKLAKLEKIPLYIIADSWKYSSHRIKLEQRDFDEVWKKIPKNSKIKIRNPAFELVKTKYIKGIISELGFMRYKKFLRVVKKKKN